MSAASPELQPRRAAELLGRIEENVHRVIVGKQRVVRLAAAGLVAGGHVPLQDLPAPKRRSLPVHSRPRSGNLSPHPVHPDLAFRHHGFEHLQPGI
jgi:hypothetical protein